MAFHVIQNVRHVSFSPVSAKLSIAKPAGVQANVDLTLCSFIDERSDKVCMSQHLSTATVMPPPGGRQKPFVLMPGRCDLVYGHFATGRNA